MYKNYQTVERNGKVVPYRLGQDGTGTVHFISTEEMNLLEGDKPSRAASATARSCLELRNVSPTKTCPPLPASGTR